MIMHYAHGFFARPPAKVELDSSGGKADYNVFCVFLLRGALGGTGVDFGRRHGHPASPRAVVAQNPVASRGVALNWGSMASSTRLARDSLGDRSSKKLTNVDKLTLTQY
jgi:hypothetical protein